MHNTPETTKARKPVEKKVTWASLGTYLGGVALLAVLTAVGSDPGLISGFPDWLESLLLPLIPAAVSFLTGYNTKHTPRPDLGGTPGLGSGPATRRTR